MIAPQGLTREFICELETGHLPKDDATCLIAEKDGLEGELTVHSSRFT